jgi:hypothetical protein
MDKSMGKLNLLENAGYIHVRLLFCVVVLYKKT